VNRANLAPVGGSLVIVTPPGPPRRIHMKERSFAGPWTLLTGGSSLGQGAATMDQTYVPAGMAIPAWRTMMGTSFDGRFVVKRKQQARLPHGIFPYASALLINAFAGRFLRIWMLVLIVFAAVASWRPPKMVEHSTNCSGGFSQVVTTNCFPSCFTRLPFWRHSLALYGSLPPS
jgi:hypothetical protein